MLLQKSLLNFLLSEIHESAYKYLLYNLSFNEQYRWHYASMKRLSYNSSSQIVISPLLIIRF